MLSFLDVNLKLLFRKIKYIEQRDVIASLFISFTFLSSLVNDILSSAITFEIAHWRVFTTKKVKSICDYIDNYKNGVHRTSPVLGKQGINRRKARELFAVFSRVMIVTVHVFIVVSHVSIYRYLGTRLSGLDCRIHSSWPGWITFIKESLKLQYHVSGPWVQYFTDMFWERVWACWFFSVRSRIVRFHCQHFPHRMLPVLWFKNKFIAWTSHSSKAHFRLRQKNSGKIKVSRASLKDRMQSSYAIFFKRNLRK